MNQLFLIGNLTRDPESKTTPSGVNVCRFGLAVTRPYNREETDFFNVTAWRNLGERVAQYCKKGNKVAVNGYIQIRNYEDNQGVKRTAVDIIAQDVEFLTPKAAGGDDSYESSSSSAPAKKKPVLQAFEDDSDIPF
ncbi:MAG: single-stranded DNA-binding protein [Clostridia bacterium]|nr:single-stranded DNA-binding protein [Clostridia bacterium]